MSPTSRALKSTRMNVFGAIVPTLLIFTSVCVLNVSAAISDNVAHLFNEDDENDSFSPPTVGAFYYPWHKDDFHRGGGYMREMLQPKHQPALGEYDDSQPETISQHLKWSRRANIKVWFCSWWGPGAREDNTIRQAILPHKELGDHKIAVLYETTGRMNEIDDWDATRVESDARYLCEHYFKHDNYYTIDGKPVIFAYLTRMLSDDDALHKLVDAFRDNCDQELFILGDQIWNAAPGEQVDYSAFDYLDGITNYDVYGNTNNPPYATQAVVDHYYDQQMHWKDRANADRVFYVPNTSPGYNDRGVRIENDHAALSRRLTAEDHEGSLFVAQLRRARHLTDPGAGRLMLVNSFNEWHEDSQIEPVSGKPTNIPSDITNDVNYDGYGTLYLDILHAATCTTGSNCSEDHFGQPDEFNYSLGPDDEDPSSRIRIIDDVGVSDLPLDQPLPPGITVGAYYYAWYGDENFNNDHPYIRKVLNQRPMLGEYNDREQAVVAQHFEWSKQANINLWVTLWSRPGNQIDTTLREHILSHPAIGDHKVALLYQFFNRIVFTEQDNSSGIGNGRMNSAPDFGQVRSDVEYLCSNYFDSPNYYTIDDRPVLFLSISRALRHEFLQEAAIAIREVTDRFDFTVYLIGDQVWSDAPESGDSYEPFLSLEAVTNHDVFGNLAVSGYAGQQSVDEYYEKHRNWRDRAWNDECGYVPSVTVGFNNGKSVLSRRLTSNSEEGSLFRASLEKARHLVDPFVGKLLMVNSFNQWMEDTQIEPAIGPAGQSQGFEYEGYGGKYLDILRELTAPQREVRIQQERPLECNRSPQFEDSQCLTWTSQYGDQERYDNEIVIPCGKCIIMDMTRPSVHLKKGLEVLGKLIFPKDSSIRVVTSFFKVDGDFVAN